MWASPRLTLFLKDSLLSSTSPPNHLQVVPLHYHGDGDGSRLKTAIETVIQYKHKPRTHFSGALKLTLAMPLELPNLTYD